MKRWATPQWSLESKEDSGNNPPDREPTSCGTCDICQQICPDLAITRSAADEIAIDLDFCKGCGLCGHYCPEKRIQMVKEK